MTSEFKATSLFFNELTREVKNRNLSVGLVTHILPDKLVFLKALSAPYDIEFIIPKPKSIHKATFNKLKKKYRFLKTSRENLDYKNKILSEIKKIKNNFVLLDMGGYFAPLLKEIFEIKRNHLLGVIEDTKNGHQKYAQLEKFPCPVYSVAQNPLKNPEDYLVGQSIVFSTDFVLRTNNIVLNNNKAGVIGYGKVGRSIAQSLYTKNIRTSIYDINPVERIQAVSHGFESSDKEKVLRESDVIFCASGNKSLTKKDFKNIKSGCFIASVTSSDDELDLSGIKKIYSITRINKYTELYKNNSNYFYLLNKGNAINFLHNAVVGSFIYLVQAEMLLLIDKLGCSIVKNKIQESSKEIKIKIAKKWLRYFNN